MLKIENISTGYGKKQVLYDVSFEVKEGEVLLLTGGNGSGKSTLLKCIYGLLPVWQGGVYFNNEKITGLPTSDLIEKGLVYIPQKNNYFENLTVQENLEVSGTIYSKIIIKERVEQVYDTFPTLKEFYKRTPFKMSGGERQLLSIGNALMHEPKMILFDEPFGGLDNQYTKFIMEEIFKFKEKNTSLLVVEHKKSLNDFTDRKFVLNLGTLKV